MDLTNTIAFDDNTNPQSNATPTPQTFGPQPMAGKFPGAITGEIPPVVEAIVQPKVEQKPNITEVVLKPEVQQKVEVITQLQTLSSAKDDDTTNAPPVTTLSIKDNTNVVDKSSQIKPVRHIEHPGDKLTAIADKEEEEFIQQVQVAHGKQ